MTSHKPENFVREELLSQINKYDFLSNVLIEDMGESFKRRGEIDLIVFSKKGILICEVKGAKEFKIENKRHKSGKDYQAWTYIQENGRSFTQNSSPYVQVTENAEAFRNWVINKNENFKKINFAKAVIFPFASFEDSHSGIADEMEITFHKGMKDFSSFFENAFLHEQNKTNIQEYSDLSEEMTNELIRTIYPKFNSKLEMEDVRETTIQSIKRHLYGPSWEDITDIKTLDQERQFTCGAIYPRNFFDNKTPTEDEENNDQEQLETSHNHSHQIKSDEIEEKENEYDAFATNFPSSFGISFLVSKNAKIALDFGFTEYIAEDGKKLPNKFKGKIDLESLSSCTIDGDSQFQNNCLKDTSVKITIKAVEHQDCCAIQIYMLNDSKESSNGSVYYQCGLKASLYEGDLLPAKKTMQHYESSNLFDEMESYGKGLNTSVEWSHEKKKIWSEFVPQYRIPRISPVNDNTTADLSLSCLANFSGKSDEEYLKNINCFINDYKKHLEKLKPNKNNQNNINNAKAFLSRLQESSFVLSENSEALKAFQMMNHAFHLNFLLKNASSMEGENLWIDEDQLILKDPENKPQWRAFQIAFCLAAIPEMVYPKQYADERKLVDLIWFPTGGGKTEAYNALLCFTILNRRINDPNNHGVNVLMRYTLRFLTVDQFNRLATLITSMNLLREKIYSNILGNELISLGVWVGRASSINKHDEAIKLIKQTTKPSKLRDKDPTFILDKCPVCKHNLFDDVKPGYESNKFRKNHTPFCNNDNCKVDEIPVYQAEECTLTKNPSAVIATVDSFAKLSWFEKKTESIFNQNLEGCDPPDLIIQDELHLIGGPLGSLVGLYDQLVRDFCSEKYPVKIVGSTATISNADNQVKNLYGNRDLQLVPPPEEKWGDSFFMKESKVFGEDRIYLGIMSTSLNGPETSIKNMAVCAHASTKNRKDVHRTNNYDDVIDPYWTILSYFNSVKELSYASAQISEIKNKLRSENRYDGEIPYLPEYTRYLTNSDEITGRKKQYELNKTRNDLQQKYNSKLDFQKALDIVLATNMISVGVDVDRLGIMIINGFPKSTSEYIQASSRVGRKHPGLVLMSYRSTKKRDLSHYENFIAMHQSIYKFVEPISVSPFSSGARQKGLIGLLTAYLQHKNPKDTPDQYSADDLSSASEWIANAVKNIYQDDEHLLACTKKDLEEIANKWLENAPKDWGKMVISPEDGPFLCAPYTGVKHKNYLFDQLTSLRNVGRELSVFNTVQDRRFNRN